MKSRKPVIKKTSQVENAKKCGVKGDLIDRKILAFIQVLMKSEKLTHNQAMNRISNYLDGMEVKTPPTTEDRVKLFDHMIRNGRSMRRSK